MLVRGFRRLFSREYPQTFLFADHSVIGGDLLGPPGANQVTSRVSDMRDHGAIEPDGAGHQRGSHSGARTGRSATLVHLSVGSLNEPSQQRFVRFSLLRTDKTGEYTLHCHARGHFALPLSANAVGQSKQTAMG